jgi:RNA polymerase sigma-70 factor (ECF subfamily)
MPDDGEDAEMLYAWRAGDRTAGDRLMRLYYAPIHRFFQLRAADVADDLTQRTFLACTEGRERVAVTVRAYLFGIARHMLLKHLDDVSRREMPLDFDGPAAPSVFNPSRVVGLRQEHWLLLRALDSVALDVQQLLALFYVEELRVREIAHVLGLSTTAVTTRLSRARETLREQVAALPAPTEVRANVLADLDAWARALAPVLSALPGPT